MGRDVRWDHKRNVNWILGGTSNDTPARKNQVLVNLVIRVDVHLYYLCPSSQQLVVEPQRITAHHDNRVRVRNPHVPKNIRNYVS